MMSFSTWDIVHNLLLAARWTVALSLAAFFGGGLMGGLVLFLRVVPNRTAGMVARFYIEVFQGTPLLLQLFLAFFAPALFGMNVPAWVAAFAALTLWTAGFLAEIWRGCVEAIPKGQWEAASTLALPYVAQLRYVVLPQALRIAVAPTVGFLVQVVKGTALTSIIGFVELSKAGTIITNATFEPFTVYGCVALLYFALCWPISQSSRWLERRLNVAHQAH